MQSSAVLTFLFNCSMVSAFARDFPRSLAPPGSAANPAPLVLSRPHSRNTQSRGAEPPSSVSIPHYSNEEK